MKSLSALCLISLAATSLLSAQEAWLIEMPNKYSDYLFKKLDADDTETVDSIIEKLPSLVANKTIKEIEKISWRDKGGVHHPAGTVDVSGQTLKTGSTYLPPFGDTKVQRILKITTAPAEKDYKVTSFGNLTEDWSPTFYHRSGDSTLILLERDPDAVEAQRFFSNSVRLKYGINDENTIHWRSTDPLDNLNLSYEEKIATKANPAVSFYSRFLLAIKRNAKTILRLESGARDPEKPGEIALYYNEVQFDGLSETNGTFKKEVTQLETKEVTQAGEEGSWTLEVVGK